MGSQALQALQRCFVAAVLSGAACAWARGCCQLLQQREQDVQR
jgi:hypothetical protein